MKPAIPEIGKVVKTEGDKVLVMLMGGESCKGCSAGRLGLCRPSGSVAIITAKNTAGAHEGDMVEIGLPRSVQRKGFLLAFIVPFACFLVGSATGHLMGYLIALPYLDVFAGLLSLLAASWYCLKKLKTLDRCNTMIIRGIRSDRYSFGEVKTEEERRFESYGVRC